MKKSIKVFLAVMMMGTLMLGLSGCGKKGGTQETAKSGFVYVPEYHKLELKSDYIDRYAVSGDIVYFSTSSYDEETGTAENVIVKYNMLDQTFEEIPLSIGENSYYISGMAVGSQGDLFLVVNGYQTETDEDGAVISEKNVMELQCLSVQDGTLNTVGDLSALIGGEENEYGYIQYFVMDGQDNLYLCDGDSTIYIADKNLKKLCEIKEENWVNTMFASREGDVYVIAYGADGMEIKKVDLSAKSSTATGINLGFNGNINVCAGIEKSALINNGSKVSAIDFSTGESEDLFYWLDVDVNSDNIFGVGELSDGRIWAVTREDSMARSAETQMQENAFELILFTRKEASEVEAKEEITFGTMWLDGSLRKNIIDFNKNSEQYRIKVKEYAEETDYQTGITQFNTDLVTGNCPDIIDLSTINVSQYAEKGILEDLYPYMDESGIKREDYLENILRAAEIDGKLYGIIPQFYIMTTLAKTSVVGDAEGWTLTEMLDFAEKQNPEYLFGYGDRYTVFYYLVYNNINDFIDWENGKCSFDSEEFTRVLELVKQFPEEYNYNEEMDGIASRIHSDQILLMQDSVSSVQQYQMMQGMYGEEINYIGFPNKDRKGNLIQPTNGCVGMAAKSKHKDGAWEFMKTLLSEEYQSSLVNEYGGGWGFPLKKSALEKQFQIDMTPEYTEDENGNQVEIPKTTWGYDDFEMEIMAATQEEVDGVMAVIQSAEKLSGGGAGGTSEQLINIINEEIEPFFKGQKSAAEAAGVIQNRIQIYVNENR